MHHRLFLTTLTCLLGVAPAHAASITFTWQPGAGPLPQGYIVERRIVPASYAEVGRPATPPYTDTVTATTLTCWQVKAYTQLGVSLPSNEVCLSLPTAPVNLTISTNGPSAALPPVTVKTTVHTRRIR